MPSDNLHEQRAKQAAALAFLRHIDTTPNPCYTQGLGMSRERDLHRLNRLFGLAESLWPLLSDGADFASAERQSARLVAGPPLLFHKYLPFAWTYRGRIMHDYARYRLQVDVDTAQAHRKLDGALAAYDSAEALYAALPEDDQYWVTQFFMRGYKAEVLFDMGRFTEAYCAADWAQRSVKGQSGTERRFRIKMGGLKTAIDNLGEGDPSRCDGEGGVVEEGAVNWLERFLWATAIVLVVIAVHLLLQAWFKNGHATTPALATSELPSNPRFTFSDNGRQEE